MKSRRFAHLGFYSDLVTVLRRSQTLFPLAPPGQRTRRLLLKTLAFAPRPAVPLNIRVVRRWERDGVAGELVTWSVGYGPRTEAWVLRPAGTRGPLPGILALHDHGASKYFGKEKIADGPAATPAALLPFREQCYGGRAFANALAREGFTVLVHDVFLWGSRKFPLRVMAQSAGTPAELFDDRDPNPSPRKMNIYNRLAVGFEHIITKYLTVIGTTLSGVLSFEDRVAAAYLRQRRDVAAGGIGCVGLSGGALRSALLQATCPHVNAAVIVGLMSTYEGMLDHNIFCHTWAYFPPGWTVHGEWPDIAACRAPSPLMVQYNREDELFTLAGMRAAHRRLRRHYTAAGAPENYVGRFYPGHHKFDLVMQRDAFAWLRRKLTPGT
mgnify:CR=1 FL=1